MDDNEKQQLHEDVRQFLWKLAGFDMLRVEYMGDMFIMDDKFLTDFSKAWGPVHVDKKDPVGSGVRDYIPQSVIEEYHRYQQQQKTNSTTVDIGEGDVHIVSSDGSDRIYIHTNRGIAEIGRDDLPDIIRVLQGLVAGRTSGGALNAPQVASAPAYEQRPNHPGWMSQAEKNDRELKRALGLDY